MRLAAEADMEPSARTWIEALLGEPLPEGPLVEQLKSGVVLCNVANAIKPGLCPTPSASKMPFKQMENIGAYLKACEVLKVPPFDTFQTVDLFEGKNTKAVLTNLHSLGRMAQLLPGYSGPVLGAKLATAPHGGPVYIRGWSFIRHCHLFFYRDSPYRREGGRENDRRPSSKLTGRQRAQGAARAWQKKHSHTPLYILYG